jgi:hypothetical protein
MNNTSIAPSKKDMDGNKKVIEITPKWAVGIIAASALTGLVSGAFGVANVLNSDHFTLLALDNQVAEIKQTYVRQEMFADLCARIDRLEDKIDWLIERP